LRAFFRKAPAARPLAFAGERRTKGEPAEAGAPFYASAEESLRPARRRKAFQRGEKREGKAPFAPFPPCFFSHALVYCAAAETGGGDRMKAIVTVVGRDRVGIIARVCTLLAARGVNVLDINQTLLQEFFTMVMLVDTGACSVSFDVLRAELKALGGEMGLSVHIQSEEIFNAMYKV